MYIIRHNFNLTPKKIYEELDIVKIKKKIVRLADKLFEIIKKKGIKEGGKKIRKEKNFGLEI